MAGYTGHAPYVTFLFARAVTPILLFIGAVLYVFVITQMNSRCRSWHSRRSRRSRPAGPDAVP